MNNIFYVCDSYHTATIAETLEKAIPGSMTITDSTIVSHSPEFPELTLGNLLTKLVTEKNLNKEEVAGRKIDFFVLSAKLIMDGSVNIKELKTKYGQENCKVIAVSTMSEFLNQVKPFVDYTASKYDFTDTEKVKEFFNKIL